MKPRAAIAPSPRQERIERLEARNHELTRALHMAEEARAHLADQYDFAPIGFVTLDASGSIRAINLTAARMLGRSRTQLLERPFLIHLARGYSTEFLKYLQVCAKTEGEVVKDLALHPLGGAPLAVELRSVPVLDPRRGDIVFRTTIIDITERVRAGNALRESEERYRELVEFSPDGIFIQSGGVIVFSNTAGLRMCGAGNLKEVSGRDLTEWVRPAFRPAVSAALQQTASVRETPPVEAKFARADGSIIDVELAARPFRHEGDPAVLVVTRDVTQRRQAERHVLAISERERSGFGRDLHDSLCQSLTGAACMAEALRNDLRRTGSAAAWADEIARVIRQCVDEARSLARGLCPVTMQESGLVAALHELTAEVAGRTRVGCSLECDDSVAINDVSVATNLYRIAQEAVANAIKHGQAKSVLIHLAANNGGMTLRVHDDGKGIPAKPKQSGMGLHTMRYRATIIGGLLDVRRDRPRGTVVTCTFPSNAETP